MDAVGAVPIKDPSTRAAADLLDDLAAGPTTGLTSEEAARRLAEDGPNELRADQPVPLWRKVLEQFQDPLVWLLLVAIAISLVAWAAEGATGAPIDALVIAAIVVANAVIGFVQAARAETAMAALTALTAARSTVLRDGVLATVPSAELVRGDVLALNAGDAVGADARLLTATNLRVQESSLTGESEAVDKDPATIQQSPIGDRFDMVFAGTDVVQGVGRAVVTGTGMDTEVGAIADLLERAERAPTPLQREIATISRTLGAVVIAIAVVVMAALAIVQGVDSIGDAVGIALMGVSLAVAAVPEGLPAVLSLVLAIGARALAEHNAVMKDLHSVEALGAASVICTDKTGTLTANQMTLRIVATASGELQLTGTGYDPAGELIPGDSPLTDEVRRVLVGGALANNAQLSEVDGEWRIEGDPTEAAFLVAHRKLDAAVEHARRYRRTAEVPFTSERKLMSVVAEQPDKVRLFTKGAPDVLLARCTSVQVGDQVIHMDADRRARAQADIARLSESGYRTLGVAYRVLEASGDADESWEHGLTYLGVVGILDPPREAVPAAVREAQRAGIRTVMITGDHPATARRIAVDLGLITEDAVAASGPELDAMDDERFRETVRTASVFARVAPSHKLRIVDSLQHDGEVVAMTGDGVNDAPALKAADIGVAMGTTGTEVAKRAAVLVLADDNYATIVAAVRQGRVIFDNIGKFLRYLLSSNLGEVATVFFGVVLAAQLGLDRAVESGELVVPLLATQVLWINLVTDAAPALAMGLDPEIDDVMARPPRRRGDRILDRAAWLRIGRVGLVMAVCALAAIDLHLPGGLFPGQGDIELARTAGFTTLVFAQLFNALNARSLRSSALRGLFTNAWLWGAIVLAAVLQALVVNVPALQQAFGTAPLSPAQWAVCVALGSVVLVVEELAKAARRLFSSRPGETP